MPSIFPYRKWMPHLKFLGFPFSDLDLPAINVFEGMIFDIEEERDR